MRTSWRMHDVHLFIILLSLLWQWDLALAGGEGGLSKDRRGVLIEKIGITATAQKGTNLGEAKLHLTPKVYHSKFWKPNNSIVISIGNEAAVTESFFSSLICSFFLFFFHFIILFHFYSHSHEQIFVGRLKRLAFPKLLWEFSFSHPTTSSPRHCRKECPWLF